MKVISIDLLLDNPKAAENFLTDVLFFKREGELLVSGNCKLKLIEQEANAKFEAALEATYIGIEHISLETYDIEAALDYCKNKGLTLETDNGKAFYNPKVWGTGMNYFNILTPFGVKIEISQRLDRSASFSEPVIFGLEHLGVQVASMEKSLSYYLDMGFEQNYPVVEIIGASRVLCSMIESSNFTVELYEFTDGINYVERKNDVIYGLSIELLSGGSASTKSGPNGENFFVY